jgi:DNA-binding Lrp family transcriptional regulator
VNSVRPTRRPTAVVLDDTDRAIIRDLVADARISNKMLAARLGIAPSTCLLRTRRLVDSGVIEGFHACVAPEAVGRALQALVLVRLRAQARLQIRAFGTRCAALPGVLNVFFLAGATDFQLHVAAESPDALRDFVVQHLSASQDVASTETNLIFEHLSPRRLT